MKQTQNESTLTKRQFVKRASAGVGTLGFSGIVKSTDASPEACWFTNSKTLDDQCGYAWYSACMHENVDSEGWCRLKLTLDSAPSGSVGHLEVENNDTQENIDNGTCSRYDFRTELDQEVNTINIEQPTGYLGLDYEVEDHCFTLELITCA